MGKDLETFETDLPTTDTPVDPLIARQKQEVQSMRSALMTCDVRDANSVRATMNNILVMRIYHQISRIIRFTEQMDKIEEKLYSSIDASMTTMLDTDPRTWLALLNIQERLQKIMIDSQKLLDPYLNMESLTYMEVPVDSGSDSFTKSFLDQDSREKLRSGAQSILAMIDSGQPLLTEPLSTSESTDEEGENDDDSN